MKPIIELVVKGGDQEKVAAVACGKCRCVARDTAEAESCCVPVKCKTCGEETTRFQTECDSCTHKRWDKETRAKEAEAFNAATKILAKDYKGEQVCLQFSCTEDDYWLLSDTWEEIDDKPWVWGCTEVPWPRPDMQRVMESEVEDEYPVDVLDWLDLSGLQAVVNGWFDEHAPKPAMYMIDTKTVVVIDPDNTPDRLASGDDRSP